MKMTLVSNIIQLGLKELRSLWHDKILAFFILSSFSIMIYSAATASSRELHNAPIGIVDEDQSPLSARIISAFYGPYFKPPRVISMDEIDPGLDAGDYTFVLNIPPDFQRDVLAGKHPMAPVISPKKSWEGFAGSVLACVGSGVALVVYFLHGEWWVWILLGVSAAVMATLGDLVESVMKRDLGIKDMSQIIPGHGGLMDRLDSLLATIAPIWLIMHYLVF